MFPSPQVSFKLPPPPPYLHGTFITFFTLWTQQLAHDMILFAIYFAAITVIFLMTKNPGHALNNPNHDYYYPWIIIIMATITIIQIPILIEIIKMMIRKIRMSGRASRSTTCGHVFHSHCLRSTIVIIINSSIDSRHISRSKFHKNAWSQFSEASTLETIQLVIVLPNFCLSWINM